MNPKKGDNIHFEVEDTSTHTNEVNSSTDENSSNKNKASVLSNEDILIRAIGQTNYNHIMDALCCIQNIEVKSKALAALFSCDGKEVQSRYAQTEWNQQDQLEQTQTADEISLDKTHSSQAGDNNPADISHIFEEECYNEVVVEYNNCAESIVTGEGELILQQQVQLPNCKFVLKGDGKSG